MAYLSHDTPPGLNRLPDDAPTGVRLFRSWVLLFGILPVDYDDLTLVRVEPGRGFLESSRLLTSRRWDHERTLEAASPGSVLTDRITSSHASAAGRRSFGSLGPCSLIVIGVCAKHSADARFERDRVGFARFTKQGSSGGPG